MLPKLLREKAARRSQLTDKAGALIKQAEAANRSLNETEETQFRALHDEADTLGREIEMYQRQATAEGQLNQRMPDNRRAGLEDTAIQRRTVDQQNLEEAEGDKLMLRAYVRGGVRSFNPEQRRIYEERAHQLEGSDPEYRALAQTTNSEGGYAVPIGQMQPIDTAMKFVSQLMSAATVIDTPDHRDIPAPTATDLNNIGEQISENSPADDSGLDPTFGVVTFKSYLISSRVVRVSMQMLDSASFDVETWLMDQLAQRIGRKFNTLATTGSGSATLTGIVTSATAGFTSFPATAIGYNDLTDLEHSVDIAYRSGPKVGWMWNDKVSALVEKLTDTSNRPILIPATSGIAGPITPRSLKGYSVWINQDMAPPAAAAKSILFGDFSKFIIRRATPYLLRLPPTTSFQIPFLMGIGFDTNVVDSGNHPLRYLTNGMS